jgi:transcriptional regulator with XRE-family HTH domain
MKKHALHPDCKISTPVARMIPFCLRGRRLAMGCSVEDLSRESGVRASTIYAIEKGTRSCKFETLERLCRGLGISVPEIVTEAQRLARRTA